MRKPLGLGVALLFAIGALISLALMKGGEVDRAARATIRTPAPDLPGLEAYEDPVRLASAPEEPGRDREPQPRAEPRVAPERRTTVSDLARAGGWMRSLGVHHALPRVAGPEEERARLEATLLEAQDPVARQNVIFLAVLTLPTDVSHAWLRGLIGGGLGGDGEDALLALAFDGDPWARAEFRRLGSAPSRAPVHRLVDQYADHEALGQAGTEEAREVLRSYRAIEVLDRQPYFKFTFYATKHAPWLPHPIRRADDGELLDDVSLELDRELLASWLARYPGHPGADDMAWRLGRIEIRREAHLDAARWFSRAATLPDQDMCGTAVEELVTTCELVLTPEELDRLAHEQGLLTPNRGLVQYIRLRRLAAEQGFDVAIRHAAALGRDEPQSVLGYAWNHRLAAPVPRGLDSGLFPAPPDDPLRAVREDPAPFVRPERAPSPTRLPDRLYPWDDPESRLEPFLERLQIDEATLMGQFRAWDAIATLELRAARATGDARADLLYKQAAILYHDPRAIFPAYADIFDFRRAIRDEDALGPFVRTSYPLLRAIRVFERIEREHPTYAGIDRVLFSRGLAWAKLLSYKCEPQELDERGPGGPKPTAWSEWRAWRDGMKIREAVAALERCVALCPRSPLADDAWRAVLYWRGARPEVFR